MAQDFPSLAGQLLIAMPALNDPNFENTVTLICEHNESGAMGLTINRPMDLTHSDVFEQIAEYDEIPTTERNARKGREPVLKGGPVALERGFVLHREKGNWDATLDIADDVYVTMSRDVLQSMLTDEGPRSATMALGYAGWEAEQLEAEILANAWLTTPATAHIVFDTPYEARWDKATEAIGVKREQLSGPAGHA
ncbi:MAG: YqgE/AlgH family protein [Pseudomonadota bacterium]